MLLVGQNHFDLTAQEFCDALALHYRKPLLNFPPCCDRCSAPSSPDHALCCGKDGLIIQRHNEICDAINDLAILVWVRVLSEPVVKDASEDSDALIADLGIRGDQGPQALGLRVYISGKPQVPMLQLFLCDT